MRLKYPLKKFHSQQEFLMPIGNEFMTTFGKDCHTWNTALLALSTKQRDIEMSAGAFVPRGSFLAEGSFQDENSIPSCKKYHPLSHTLKNLYISPFSQHYSRSE